MDARAVKAGATIALLLLLAGCGSEGGEEGAPPGAVDVPTPSGPPVVQQLNEQDDAQPKRNGRAP